MLQLRDVSPQTVFTEPQEEQCLPESTVAVLAGMFSSAYDHTLSSTHTVLIYQHCEAVPSQLPCHFTDRKKRGSGKRKLGSKAAWDFGRWGF